MAIVDFDNNATMINNTWWEYLFIRSSIFLLQSISPLSIAYTATTAQKALVHAQWQSVTPLRVWCALETIFAAFILCYRIYLQREAIHPPLRSHEERRELFSRINKQINDPTKFLSGWFRGADIEDIGRDELKRYLDWSLWEGRAQDANENELEEYTQGVEKMMGRTLPPGRGKVQSIRLTLDPIDMDCRSLLWYMIIMLIDTIVHIKLLWYGMTYHSSVATSLGVFPPRPAALVAKNKSPSSRMAYWSRPHTSTKRLPVVFLHGLGVGLYPYAPFLNELNLALNSSNDKDDGEVGILAIEILPISSRLTHDILRRKDFLEQLTKILDAHGYDRFVLASHSYGSILTTNILTHEPLVCRVAATFMIDPVTILLHMPDVAYNFTARPPKYANEWQLWYFASKDPGIAHTLGRHFFWSENLLWRERIMELAGKGMRITASLASRDLIVDTQAVGGYLADCDIPDPVIKTDGEGKRRMQLESTGEKTDEEWKHRAWTGKGLEVLWFEGIDHAQCFDYPNRRKELVDIVVEYSRII